MAFELIDVVTEEVTEDRETKTVRLAFLLNEEYDDEPRVDVQVTRSVGGERVTKYIPRAKVIIGWPDLAPLLRLAVTNATADRPVEPEPEPEIPE